MYHVRIKNSAKGDLKKLKHSNLNPLFEAIIVQLKKNPYFPNQGFEKLRPPSEGKYSRRINIQHRVVYTVNESKKLVMIYAAWTHYE